MQVDFYQLTRDPVEKVIPPIASRIVSDGGRLLAVNEDIDRLERLSVALWNWSPESFLAHAKLGEVDDAIQPILLSLAVDASNGARFVALTDGVWRDEALAFDRAFYLFEPAATEAARSAWRSLGEKPDVERRYWKQDGGKWREGP